MGMLRSVQGAPSAVARRSPRIPLTYLRQARPNALAGTWRDASPARIERSLAAALAKPTGGWLVAGASSEVGTKRTLLRTINGREVVLWRDVDGTLLAGRGACPHLGAALADCDVVDGTVLCRWHGMPLGERTTPRWATYAAYDDGHLIWLRLGSLMPGEQPTDAPYLAKRPTGVTISSSVSMAGTCEPRDIIANRLDPWHGAWLHPYAFSDLTVIEEESDDDRLTVEVAYRLGTRFAVPVRAVFECPDSHTIIMTIVDGEGTGSVVETHATPVTREGDHPAHTVMTELVVATSPRFGFAVARAMAPLVAVGMRASARQLWADDLMYAQRRYELRHA